MLFSEAYLLPQLFSEPFRHYYSVSSQTVGTWKEEPGHKKNYSRARTMHVWSTIQQLYPKHLLSAGSVRKQVGASSPQCVFALRAEVLHCQAWSTAFRMLPAARGLWGSRWDDLALRSCTELRLLSTTNILLPISLRTSLQII